MSLSDAAGVVQTTYTYESFGKTNATGSSSNVFQHTGRENDDTGLYYYRARFYSSTLHRFASEDPFPGLRMLPATLNRFPYVLNNPLSYRDPTGKIIFAPIVVGALIGGIGGMAGAVAQHSSFTGVLVSGITGAVGGGAAVGFGLSGMLGGALIGELSNVGAQLILNGRKPIDVGSVVGSTIGGALSGVAGNLIMTEFTHALGKGLAADALGTTLSTATSTGINLVTEQLGRYALPF